MSNPTTPSPESSYPTSPDATDNRDLAAQQRDRFGGMKFGACFLGWTTALGIVVVITTLVGLVVGLGGLSAGVDPTSPQTTTPPIGDLRTVGLVGVIVVLVAEFLAFLGGGYVAGRMARFKGLRQGFGVWLWSVIATAVVIVIGLVAQGQLTQLSGLPGAVGQLPSTTTSSTVIGVAVVLGISLVGALLGGLAGMAYHRRVDRYTGDTA